MDHRDYRTLHWTAEMDGPWSPAAVARYAAGGYDGLLYRPPRGVRHRSLDFLLELPGLRSLTMTGRVADDSAVNQIESLEHLVLLAGSPVPLAVGRLRRLRSLTVDARADLTAGRRDESGTPSVRWHGPRRRPESPGWCPTGTNGNHAFGARTPTPPPAGPNVSTVALMVGRRRRQAGSEDESRDRPLRLFRQRRREGVPTQSPQQCEHLEAMPARDVGAPTGCDDHQPGDGTVVHLRVCLTCGHVGCCDSSAPRHATAHANSTGHPVIESAEAGESWRWCYVHELLG